MAEGDDEDDEETLQLHSQEVHARWKPEKIQKQAAHSERKSFGAGRGTLTYKPLEVNRVAGKESSRLPSNVYGGT